MGNCSPKPKRKSRSTKKTLAPPSESPTPIQLHGSENSLSAWRIRLTLLYKNLDFDFIECEDSDPFLQLGSETVKGSEESLIEYIEKRFGGEREREEEKKGAAEVFVVQHRSVERHMEGLAFWAEKMKEEGGDGRKMGKIYGDLVEIMLEHAQMEERFLFQELDWIADKDVCRSANEEHGRDLPLMNGIKEDIKSLISMDVGGPSYKEVLLNLSLRFRTLKERCKQHFEDEERDLVPLLEAAAESVKPREREGEENLPPSGWVEQMVNLMEQTHSRLFPFFTSALFPHEVLRYVSLISGGDQHRSIAFLRSIVLSKDASKRPFFLYNTCT